MVAVVDVKMPVTAVVIGAGDRGFTYSGYALDFPDKLKVCINSVLLFSGLLQVAVFV